MKLTPEEENKIKKIQSFEKDKDFAMFEETQNITEALNNFKNIEMIKIKGDKGDSVKGDKGDSIKGDKGDSVKGDKPTTAELLKIIKPLIPEPIKGKDADINDIVEQVLAKVPEVDKDKIVELVVKQLPTSGEAIRNSLELLQDDERIDFTAIKGLTKLFDEMKQSVKKITQGRAGGGTPHNMLMVADLTSQCNGTTKSFNVPLHRKAIKVESTQFPVIFRPTTDFTTSNYTLTLTSEVGAPSTGQTLIFYYIK